jgi:hypothetical protein
LGEVVTNCDHLGFNPNHAVANCDRIRFGLAHSAERRGIKHEVTKCDLMLTWRVLQAKINP